MPTHDQVSEALKRANAVLGDRGRVMAYKLRWDEDIHGHVTDLLVAVPREPDVSSWPLSQLDPLCEIASEALGDLVLFAYCDFQTPARADEYLAGPLSWEWVPLYDDDGRVAV